MLKRWLTAIRATVAWRQVRHTGVWTYYENTVDGRRLAVQSRQGHQALDLSFIRPGDLVWGRGGMRFYAPEPPLVPWKEWRLG